MSNTITTYGYGELVSEFGNPTSDLTLDFHLIHQAIIKMRI